jgi:general nucleoside transport system permease protein
MLEIITTIIQVGLHSATPILFVALGEMIVERSGVLNLGLEGMMIIGALAGFYFGLISGSFIIGMIMAIVITGLFSLIHGFLVLSLKANQVVSGLSLTFLGLGLASFFGRNFINKAAPFIRDLPVPFLSDIPVIGKIFFSQNILVYFSFLLIPILWFFLYRTKHGLHLQVCGESPVTADTAGINVLRTRYIAVFFGGAMAGIGGAFLTLADSSTWINGISAGRGWIAVAIVIFGGWDPIKVTIGSYLFGSLAALQFRLQAYGITIPPTILEMIPYIFTIIVLTITSIRGLSQKIGSPKALGNPYERESRD